MKKILVIISMLLFSLLLIGCIYVNSYKFDKSNPVKLTIWHHFIGAQKTAFDDLISQFNNTEGRSKGIIITAISMDNTGDIHDKLLQAAKKEVGAPQMPDIATSYPSTAYTLYKMNILTRVDKYFTQDELSSYVGSFIKEGYVTTDSGLLMFPIAKSTEVLFVNNTSYQAFLSDYNAKNPDSKLSETMLSTFEGLDKTTECYYDWTNSKTPTVENDGKALFGFDSVSNFSIIGYHQLGFDFFINQNLKPTIDFNKAHFNKIWDNYYTPMVKGYYGAFSLYRSQDVQTGDLLMYAGSTAGATFFPKTVIFDNNTKYDADLKVLPYPVFEGGKKAAVQQGAGMIVIKSTPEKEYAASVFLKWFTEPQRNTQFVLKTGYLPVTKEAIAKILPSELETIKNNSEYLNVYKVIKATLEMMKNYDLYIYEPFENGDNLRYSFEDALLKSAQNSRDQYVKTLASGKTLAEANQDFINNSAAMDNFINEVNNEFAKIKQ